MTNPKIPHDFSPDAWAKLNGDQQRSFWEGWIAALNFALTHASPDGLGELTREIAASEEALNAVRGQ